jgi:multisubunit Na+/H+ antiporter MnhG subunit
MFLHGMVSLANFWEVVAFAHEHTQAATTYIMSLSYAVCLCTNANAVYLIIQLKFACSFVFYVHPLRASCGRVAHTWTQGSCM